MSERSPGILFVIAAPSGTGKSTVARRLLSEVEGLKWSVSFTTRKRRDAELDGQDYHFIDREAFEAMRLKSGFLESAEVYGNLYGTGLAATRQALADGFDLLLEVDVQGAEQVRNVTTEPFERASVMILPPDYDTLRHRLEKRGSEDDASRAKRLAKARRELTEYERFDYLIVNEDLERTVRAAAEIVRSERRRTRRCTALAQRILATFPE